MDAPDQNQTRPPHFSLADALSLTRIPLALAFVLIPEPLARVLVVLLAGLSDMGDGWLARQWGSSRRGKLLDPVTDKIFMATAFAVVLWERWLPWYAVAAALLRDIIATAAFLVAPRSMVAARPGGKLVTVLQFLTLLGSIFLQPWRVPLAWLTALVAVYALREYWQPFLGKFRTP